MGVIACTGCGKQIEESSAIYGDTGMVCISCDSDTQVAGMHTSAFVGGASGAATLALLSFCFNPFGLLSIFAIVGGVKVLQYPASLDEEDRASLKYVTLTYVFAVCALLLGSMGLLAYLATLM